MDDMVKKVVFILKITLISTGFTYDEKSLFLLGTNGNEGRNNQHNVLKNREPVVYIMLLCISKP